MVNDEIFRDTLTPEQNRAMVERIETEARLLRAQDARQILERVPQKWRRMSIAELTKCAKTFARPLLEAEDILSRNTVLLGVSGSGKTAGMSLLFRKLLWRGVRNGGQDWELAKRLQWFSAAQLVEDAKAHPLGKGEVPEFLAAIRCPLLFLNDVGFSGDVATVRSVFAERYEAGLPIVFSSEADRPTLLSTYAVSGSRRMGRSTGERDFVLEAF